MFNDDVIDECHFSHLKVLESLVGRIETHLLTSEDVKATYSDYLRMVQFLQESGGDLPSVMRVEWIDRKQPHTTA